MNQNQNTKKALRGSLTALFLCIVMLIGTTFAWFTDSVSSGTNVIQSGNLDVELEYSKDGTNWTNADGATDLFDSSAKWEPGHVEVVYLKVSNAGDLALKYKLGVNVLNTVIGKTADGQDIDLSEFLKFGIAEPDTVYADRPAALAAVTGSAASVSQGYTSEEKTLAAGASSNMIAMVVYMPEDVSNDANHNGTDVPSIEMGVKLAATQTPYESDSFGNDYDENAQQPIMQQETAVETLKDETTKDVVIDTDITISDSTERFNISADKNIDFGNKTITRESSSGSGLIIGEKGYSAHPVNVTIENANFVSEARSAAVRVESGSTVTFKNVSFKGSEAVQIYNTGAKTTLVFENCTFNGVAALASGNNPGEYDVIFRDCTFKGTFGNGGAAVDIGSHAYGNITFEGCNIDITRNGNAVSGIDIGSYSGSNGNNSITVNLNNTNITVNEGDGNPGQPVSINTKDITTLNITGDCTFTYDGVEKTFNTASKTWQ